MDFFGRPASTSPGLAFMSAQSGAPVVPAFVIRKDDDRHVVLCSGGFASASGPRRRNHPQGDSGVHENH